MLYQEKAFGHISRYPTTFLILEKVLHKVSTSKISMVNLNYLKSALPNSTLSIGVIIILVGYLYLPE
jgi:hypothetical protein